MELVRVDTQRAYELIREMINTLELAPAAPIDEAGLADKLGLGLAPVHEAIKLLVHDGLVVTQHKGLYVADVNLDDLEQISEIRLLLEGFCAHQAAQRASADDLAILEALRQEQLAIPAGENRRLFEVDHKFHQAIARAAHNKYLAQSLDRYFGLSQRLWYLVLPHLRFLPAAVEKHLELVDAIQDKDAERAENIMRDHVQDFYGKVRQVLTDLWTSPSRGD
jgi:DNA-binding GntR family transcriptional regulator